MSANVDNLFAGEPDDWIASLPAYSRDPIQELMRGGAAPDEIAAMWVSATAANTFRFSTEQKSPAPATFTANVKKEVREFICGTKYKKERDALFGENALSRTMLISGVAAAIAPAVGVATAVLLPVVALVLASLGKIAINAWCATPFETESLAAQKTS
jgi:hypothetical protein